MEELKKFDNLETLKKAVFLFNYYYDKDPRNVKNSCNNFIDGIEQCYNCVENKDLIFETISREYNELVENDIVPFQNTDFQNLVSVLCAGIE